MPITLRQAEEYGARRHAFPGDGMCPTSLDRNAQSFAIARCRATHVRLEALSSQCTGGEDFQDDKDTDPANNSGCPTGAPTVARVVEAAELQVSAEEMNSST